MNTALVNIWLRRRLRAALAWNAFAMVGFLLGGLLVLFVSFWVTYGVLWFISHSFFPLPHHVLLLIAAGFMILVVIVGARQNWEDLDPLGRQVGLAKDMDITLTPWTRYGMRYDTNAVKAGAFEVRSLASVINYVLCGGVKLVLGSFGKLRHVRRLKTVDVNGCAQVIAQLHAAGKRQSFSDLAEKLPELNPVRTFEDLRWIEGVLFLTTEPPGLTLHPELRDEMNNLLSSRQTRAL